MEKRCGVVVLFFVLVLSGVVCAGSEAFAGGKPFIEFFNVWAYNNGPSGMKTALDVGVADPNGSVPGTITSLNVTGPGGFSYSFAPSDLLPWTTDEYWHKSSGTPTDGQYAVTVTDNEGKSSTSYHYLTVGQTIPLPDSSTFQAFGSDPLTPTLTWSTIQDYPGNLFYRAQIYNSQGNTVWSSPRSFNYTRVTVPSGILQAGQNYTWQVDAFDNSGGSNSNNRSGVTVPLNVISLSAGHSYAALFSVFKAHNFHNDGNYSTGVYLEGYSPSNQDPTSLVLNGPDSFIYSFNFQTDCGEENACWHEFSPALPDGLYTLTVTDSVGTSSTYFHMSSFDVPTVDSATCRATGNSSAPTLSWGAPAGITKPLYYVVYIRDASQNVIWKSSPSTNTSVSVSSGALQAGTASFQWQVAAHDLPYTDSANRSFSAPITLSTSNAPFFTYTYAYDRNDPTGHFAAFHAKVGNPGGTVPDGITSLTVTGPGVNYTFQQSDYNADNEYFKALPAPIQEGLYTFTVTNSSAQSAVSCAYYKPTAAGTIPSFDENTFQLSGDPSAPTISWSSIPNYSKMLYYRVRIVDSDGNHTYTSSYNGNFYAVVPAGKILQGNTYRYRVEAVDSTANPGYSYRAVSNYYTIQRRDKLTPVMMLLLTE